MAPAPHSSTHGRPRPAGPDESRAVPPRSPISPGGRTTWPRPSLTARMVVYGGIALAAAGATAGAVIIARNLVGRDEDQDRTPPAPEFAAARQDRPAPPADIPAAAPKPRRKRRRNAMRLADITHAVGDASHFLNAALAGLRSVASQAQGLHDQYRDLATTMRDTAAPAPDREGAAGPRSPFRSPTDAGHDR